MAYDVVLNGKSAEIRLAGELTFAHHGKFRQLVERLRHAVADQVTFDLSAVDYVDAAGLGLLLVVRDAVGARAEIRGAQGEVGRLLRVARFQQLFEAA